MLVLEFLECRSLAANRILLMIIVRRYFPRQITISKPNCKFLRISESCTHDLNLSATLAWPALWINLVDSDRRVEQCTVVVCKDIREDAVFSVANYLPWCNLDVTFTMANKALAP